ncbi:MAG TPA: hypothetical protein VLA19_24060 [Herpetosiphonaceae bacterium]|nr:hypothetical protein [Herpetosiphonaceae bacterium]
MREQLAPRVSRHAHTGRRPCYTTDLVAAALAFLAGVLHLYLLPEHWEESLLFGIVFLSIAVFQLGIAVALVLWPGPVARSIGRWGSFVVVLMFIGVRIVPPPGGNGLPEAIEGTAGLLSLLLELGALAALAVILPARLHTQPGFPIWTTSAVGGVYFVLQLIASGSVSYVPKVLEPAFAMRFLPYSGGFPTLSPALTVLIAHHWWFYLPLVGTVLTGVVAVLLAIAVGRTIELSRMYSQCRTRIGLLGILPASLAAPVCCGPSLLSAAGLSLSGLLGFLAVPLLGLSALLLLLDISWLTGQLQRANPVTQHR